MAVYVFKMLTLVASLCLIIAQYIDYRKSKNKIELFLLGLYAITLICMIVISVFY